MKFIYCLFLLLVASATSAQTRIIEVLVSHGQHQVQNTWLVDGRFEDPRIRHAESLLLVTLWQKDVEVDSYLVRNPIEVRSPLRQDGYEAEHQEQTVEQAVYHLRIPSNHPADRITIEPINTPHTQLRSLHKAQPVLQIDLNNL